jgi:hypothetical protein
MWLLREVKAKIANGLVGGGGSKQDMLQMN